MLDQPKTKEDLLAEYRKALHNGKDVSVEEVATRGMLEYEFAKGNVVSQVSIPIAPPTPTQPQAYIPVLSGSIAISGMFTGFQTPWNEVVEDETIIKEELNKMGNKVLRHVNAHETSRLGELSWTMREKLEYLKKSASLSNDQWKAFAELTDAINEMIGDPSDPEPIDPD